MAGGRVGRGEEVRGLRLEIRPRQFLTHGDGRPLPGAGVRDRILVDQCTPTDEWIYVGMFDFDDSRPHGIMITDEANDCVIADAVELVYAGSLPWSLPLSGPPPP